MNLLTALYAGAFATAFAGCAGLAIDRFPKWAPSILITIGSLALAALNMHDRHPAHAVTYTALGGVMAVVAWCTRPRRTRTDHTSTKRTP